MSNWRENVARDCLLAIKQHTTPTTDRSTSHGAPGQPGAILWENHEPFAIQAIMEALQTALDINPEKGKGFSTTGEDREYPARAVRTFMCEHCDSLYLRCEVNNRVDVIVSLSPAQWVEMLMADDSFVTAVVASLGRNLTP